MNLRAPLFAVSLLLFAPAALAQDAAAPVARLDHVAIWSADLQKSIDFYHAVFGLTEFPSPFPPGGPRWMHLANGVELHIQPGRVEPVNQPRRVHMAIALASLDPVMAWLKAHGQNWTNIEGTPGAINATRTDGIRQIFLQDPDGYWIEVNDALKKR
jgi:lactoylglutathione lyase